MRCGAATSTGDPKLNRSLAHPDRHGSERRQRIRNSASRKARLSLRHSKNERSTDCLSSSLGLDCTESEPRQSAVSNKEERMVRLRVSFLSVTILALAALLLIGA